MANIDKQKEIVSFWRVGFYVIVGAIFGVVSYLFNNFDKLDKLRLILINITIIFLIFLLIFIAKILIREINKLEDME